MKLFLTLYFTLVLNLFSSFANNVQVTNVRLTGQNTTDDFTMVEFDISWDNSWRYESGPSNWDAAWIFIKYRIGNAGEWIHAWLNNTGHVSCSSTTIQPGLLTPGSPFDATNNPALGVFLHRSVSGTGAFSCQDIQLRWNYGANGVMDNDEVDIRVFAIEHVYIPQGSFVVGSGGNEPGAFYSYPGNDPYYIQSEDAITIGTANGNLYYSNSPGNPGDQSGPIPAAYPKGYAAFYAMKHEISQGAYVDFLNTLTRSQQANRVRTSISGTNISNKFVMYNSAMPAHRNGISCRTTIPPSPAPVEFFNNYNNDGNENDPTDLQHVGCNWLQYNDVAAYLDWAGLRLMTEFEFEKCGRGPLQAHPNGMAWGNNIIYFSSSLSNQNTSAEIPAEAYANAASPTFGALRVGCFARANSNRTTSGAGYYGCLDLSGNLRERGVSIGNPQGRSYTGLHGDGILTSVGHADVTGWPSVVTATGVFFRGGGWNDFYNEKRLSDRSDAANSNDLSTAFYGGRGVRTAE
jgi:formylglycine-generating enzyme required for sulfatase activity